MIVIKIGLSGLAMTYYLQKHSKKEGMGTAFFGIGYALSGYMAAYSWNIMWLDCIILLPLIALGLERLVNKKKGLMYAICLGLSITSNYYISIMICMFLIFYFVALLVMRGVTSKKDFFIAVLQFGFFSLLAGGISAMVLLPEIFALKATASGTFNFPQVYVAYFSIIDILGILTESENPRKYWSVFKVRLKKEGNELATICSQLKMKASDGKMRQTDVANMQGIFRIIQSVPSPKAEPFKMWLAEVGKERIDEIIDPELTIDRALETYAQKGYSREWINQRLQAIQVRKELTDAWQDHGVEEGKEYAILTNEISKAWSGMTTREYKDFKGLKKQNLRDNMSSTELILNMLAEAATKDITNATNPYGLEENRQAARDGGKIAGNARKEIEEHTGKAVITSQNAIDFGKLISDVTKELPENRIDRSKKK